jgi:ADP-ribose pyrophosphatase YjhB (NUDIX family)
MTTSDHPLSQAEFDAVYAKVPRLTVEVVMRNPQGEIYLTKRAIEPCKGQWHLPGGTVRFGEPLAEAVQRVAARELGVAVTKTRHVGVIEYPSHYLHGLDSPVGLVYEVTACTGELRANDEAETAGWFSKLPQGMHADQDTFLLQNNFAAK